MRTNKAKRTTRLAKNGRNNVLIQRPPVLSLDLDFAADVGLYFGQRGGFYEDFNCTREILPNRDRRSRGVFRNLDNWYAVERIRAGLRVNLAGFDPSDVNRFVFLLAK